MHRGGQNSEPRSRASFGTSGMADTAFHSIYTTGFVRCGKRGCDRAKLPVAEATNGLEFVM